MRIKEENKMTTAFKTDQYELTMLQAALSNGTAHKKAVFELFARRLPTGRAYGVVTGTARAIEAAQNFHFTSEQIGFLRSNKIVNEETIAYLENYKFEGTIEGYREGDLFFPYSPILTVIGTFGDAVLLETVLLSIMNYDSAVGSAAARMVQAAHEIPVFELGSRRAHEEAAVAAARAAYIAGFMSTSNLEAGMKYGIPTMGTSAHAFTLAHETEIEAFQAQVDSLGVKTTLLVDTYDIEQGIRNAIKVAGSKLGAIRIDSGNLVEETFKARKLLDQLAAFGTKIILSSDIDEYIIDDLYRAHAPVAGIGAGTKVVTGSGHPTAGMVYKLVAIEGDDGIMRNVAKKAEGKISVGGRKNAYRIINASNQITEEVIMAGRNVTDVKLPTHTHKQELIVTYMKDGKVVFAPTLDEIRDFHKKAIKQIGVNNTMLNPNTEPAVATRYEIGE